ncbi:MAG: Maf-like protein [Draconibacterium sp.]
MNWFPKYNFILASKSPRRQELLNSLGIEFEVRTEDTEEDFPEDLKKEEIPVYLAKSKAEPFFKQLNENDLLITADTIVWLNGEVLGKPANKEEAVSMLRKLSGKKHEVISGVCLTSNTKNKAFYSISEVQFKELSSAEIDFYVSKFNPLDKAGAYGIQEWIGFIGITHIEGSFYNVMGLPIQKLYEEIQKF